MHRCMYVYNNSDSISTHPLASRSCLSLPSLYDSTPLLLTWRSCSFCSWCEYPSTLVPGLLSIVLPLLLHPPQGTPTDQVTYLQIRHQRQTSCLTHKPCNCEKFLCLYASVMAWAHIVYLFIIHQTILHILSL
jgi:hypothetical protein